MTSPVPFPPGNVNADFDDIIIDSAVAWSGDSQISITRGALSFDPQEVWEDYDFPGKTMPVAGLDEVVSSRPIIKGTMMLTGEAQLSIYRPDGTWSDGASAGGVTTSGIRTFTPGAFRSTLVQAKYLRDFIVFWKRQRGDFIAVQFPFALCTKYDLKSQDGDEGMIAVEFEACQPNNAAPSSTPPYTVITLPPETEVPDPGDNPSDLPEDTDLGNIILDLNADTLALSDGAAVTSWTDDSGVTGNGSAFGGSQTAPTYRTSGFGGGAMPRVSMSGNQGVATPIPSPTNHTTYFVVDVTSGAGTQGDGGNATGNAPIMETSGQNNYNGWVTVRGDGKLQAGVNGGSFGFPSAAGSTDITDGPHVVAFTWDESSFVWQVYVDAVLEAQVSGDPLIGNSWAGLPRMYWGNVGTLPELIADFGRIVTYDRYHTAGNVATVTSALSAIWGTP